MSGIAPSKPPTPLKNKNPQLAPSRALSAISYVGTPALKYRCPNQRKQLQRGRSWATTTAAALASHGSSKAYPPPTPTSHSTHPFVSRYVSLPFLILTHTPSTKSAAGAITGHLHVVHKQDVEASSTACGVAPSALHSPPSRSLGLLTQPPTHLLLTAAVAAAAAAAAAHAALRARVPAQRALHRRQGRRH